MFDPSMKLLLLIFRNLRRSWLRTTLTALGTMVLVVVVTMSWSFLAFFDDVTAEKSKNFKAIITERWQIPSQMPMTYAPTLAEGAARNAGRYSPHRFDDLAVLRRHARSEEI